MAAVHPEIVARLKNEAATRLAEITANKRPAGRITGPRL